MTFAEFRAVCGSVYKDVGFVLVAAEDIPGFYKKGMHMYGNCDDMIVDRWLYEPITNVCTVSLKGVTA